MPNITSHPTVSCLVAASLLTFSACDNPSEQTDSSDEDSSSSYEVMAQSWQPVDADDLTPHQQTMADYAGTSRGLMGQRLMGTVMDAANEDGFGAAIEVCQQEAEPIADEIASRRQVNIGRTSTELRNPDNLAPQWARDHVQAGVDDQFYAAGDDGSLATAMPIHLAAPCMNCHGESQHLADGVPEALDLHYPDDVATGYQKGDLRGWFWVEVPGDVVDPPEPDDLPDEPTDVDIDAVDDPGEALYVQYCASCHGRDGQGAPSTFPPLVDTPTATDDPTALIAITLDGVSGPLEVLGDSYDGFMPGQAQLSDEEVAYLLTYIRRSWGNDAPPVTSDMVRRVRDITADRTSAWNADDLDELWDTIAEDPWIANP